MKSDFGPTFSLGALRGPHFLCPFSLFAPYIKGEGGSMEETLKALPYVQPYVTMMLIGEKTMASISITKARDNLYSLVEQVNTTSEPVLIVNSKGKNAVLLSESDWNDIAETLALEAVPGFTASVQKAAKEDYTKKKPYSKDDKW
jgi:antitoxin YefM